MSSATVANDVAADRDAWRARFAAARSLSEALAAPLSPEDQTVQSMPDASPTKWHLAHTSWFFEAFLLTPHLPGYAVFHPQFGYLFNSYYEAVGARHPRPTRGLVTRPGAQEVLAYRAHVDTGMERLIADAGSALWAKLAQLVELGLAHEQQHQELILMDAKHMLAQNPLLPAYREAPSPPRGDAGACGWIDFAGGLRQIGHAGPGFAFDNEGPRHKVWLEPFRLASRLVACGEYLEFVESGGYRQPAHWLSDGWAAVQGQGWEAPLYWRRDEDDGWRIFTLAGERALNPAEPVCHVSHYEADAFARWAGKRLPSEAEWEVAAQDAPAAGNLLDSGALHPRPADGESDRLAQAIGDVWEWTASAYSPYPGYRAAAGALGEYNGKFMSGQMSLRGGSAVTPADHVRISYRNFFPPAARWAFAGLRLAEDAA
jgi:ergothioneine biosynthesis protein EgtB